VGTSHFCHYRILLFSDLPNYFSTYKIFSISQLRQFEAEAVDRSGRFYHFRILARLPTELFDIKPGMNKTQYDLVQANRSGVITSNSTNQL
jgi:hypothetical protein